MARRRPSMRELFRQWRREGFARREPVTDGGTSGGAREDPGPVAHRGRNHRNAGRYREALADLDRALDIDPDYLYALITRAGVLRDLLEFGQALRDLDRALELDPDNPYVLIERAFTHRGTGRATAALADLGRVADVDYDWLPVLTAELLLECDRGEEALRRLEEGADSARADMSRSEAHRRAGRWAAARHFAACASAVDPLGGTYQLARAVAESQGLASSAPLWRRVQELADGADAGELSRAWLHAVAGYALGDWDRADHCLSVTFEYGLDWSALDDFTGGLASLFRSPGADRSRLHPRLAHVAAARDAVRARYARDPD